MLGGNDTIYLVPGVIGGGDLIDGGDDIDQLNIDTSQDVTVDLTAGTTDINSLAGTVANIENVTTGSGNDTIVGDIGNNVLNGGAGDDDIFAGAGDDTLTGGAGFNRLFAQTGVDVIYGGDDTDQVLLEDLNGDTGDGGLGFDALIFNFGSGINIDLISGAASLVGGGGSGTFTNFESVVSQGGGATVLGTNARNGLTVNGGNNIIDGRDGDDTIVVNGAGDTIDGGLGFDDVRFTTTVDVTINLSTDITDIAGTIGSITSIDQVETGTGNDSIVGDAGNNILNGGEGNDSLDGLAGNNTLLGGGGNDQIVGRAGNDNIQGNDGNDVIQTGTGVDTVDGGDGNDIILLGDLNGDTADGGAGFDAIQFNFLQSVNFDLATGIATLVGGGGSGSFTNFEAATIFGAGGATVTGTSGLNNIDVRGSGNTISMLDGSDGLNVDTGGNDIDGGAGVFDSVRFNTNEDVTVDLSVVGGFTSTLGVTGTITGFEVVRTRGGNDDLTGDATNNRFEVGTGADIVAMGDGDDIIFVEDGGDTLDGGGGLNDTIFITTTDNVVANISLGTLQIGADAVSSMTDIENIVGNSGNDTLTGDAGSNNLQGLGGNDSINGGDGNDAIVGGDGMDILFGGAGNDNINGGADNDIADYTGTNSTDYTITNLGGGSWTVQDNTTPDFDTLTSIETLQFDDLSLLV